MPKGFTLVEIMVVVAVIGLLAAIAIPNFVSSRATAAQHACIANLRQLDSAIQMYQIETGTWPTAFNDLNAYLRRIPTTCPFNGSSYTLNPASGNNLPYTSCPTHGRL